VTTDEKWPVARLIPISSASGVEAQERRLASALLAVMAAVPEFGNALLKPLGAPSGRFETFIEVPFKLEGKPEQAFRVPLLPTGAHRFPVGRSGGSSSLLRLTLWTEPRTALLLDALDGVRLSLDLQPCFTHVAVEPSRHACEERLSGAVSLERADRLGRHVCPLRPVDCVREESVELLAIPVWYRFSGFLAEPVIRVLDSASRLSRVHALRAFDRRCDSALEPEELPDVHATRSLSEVLRLMEEPDQGDLIPTKVWTAGSPCGAGSRCAPMPWLDLQALLRDYEQLDD
jgi:hypothetical protein